MHLAFTLSRPIRARGLRFPYALNWQRVSGTHVISADSSFVRTHAGASWVLPAENCFSVAIEPDAHGCAAGMLIFDSFTEVSGMKPDYAALAHAFAQPAPPFGQTLAQQMFSSPDYPWSAAEIATCLGIDKRTLQMRLFREAYSFASALRRCRLLRCFLAALSTHAQPPDAWLRSRTGEPRKLDAIFETSYGTRLSTIEASRLPIRSGASFSRGQHANRPML
ncbi:hypothetical protein LJR230_005069 [Trinickia sp. LjRoot230]|uniref:hypothetical protein n=1 Tax=Trinickia sp. LjRoot230 TaxID=3342288 RepID=UPI003ED0BB74